MTAAQSPSRLVRTLFLLIAVFSTLSTALPAPAPPPVYRGGRAGRIPVPPPSSRLARRAEHAHEVAGHARWSLGLHGDELAKRQAMANPAVVNAKATQVAAPPVAATPVVAAPVAVIPTAASVVASSSVQPLSTVSSTVSSVSASTSTAVPSASTALSAAVTPSSSSSSSSSSPASLSASSVTSSASSSSTATSSPSSAPSTTISSPSSSSTASADDSSQPASSGSIFSTSNRLFAVGLVVIIAIIVIGLLALMYVVKRVSHLPRFADARDYPHHQPAYAGLLPLMRGSTDLEKTLSNASDSSRRGLLYGRTTTSPTAGATSPQGTSAPRGQSAGGKVAAPAPAPAPWTTFSSPVSAPAPPTVPPKAVPRLLSTISETSEPLSRTPSPVERPQLAVSAVTASSQPAVAVATAGRAKVVDPESYPRQPGFAPVTSAPRYKWSPPQGKESGLRWQV